MTSAKKTSDSTKSEEPDAIAMSLEELAVAIEKMSDLGERLTNSRLTKRAVEILVKDLCPPSVRMSDIREVLSALPRLKDHYLKKVKKGT